MPHAPRINANASPNRRRHFLRSVVAPKRVVQVGEPIRVRARLHQDAPEHLTAQIGGAEGLERFVTFETPGLHRVPIAIGDGDGRIDRTEIEFEVVPLLGPHPYPIMEIRREPTNPFLLLVSLKNAAEVWRAGATFEWRIDHYGTFAVRGPFFVVDCDRLTNSSDLVVPIDLHFTVTYPDGIRRTATEGFEIWNDYVWFKRRGVLKPRLIYDFRAWGMGKRLAASCTLVNDDDEHIEINGRQIEILRDDPDAVLVPGPLERFGESVGPRSELQLDCSIPRRQLPAGAIGYALHFHGRTRSGLKVEASAYFEYYQYRTKLWSGVTSVDAVNLLQEVKMAVADSEPAPRS